MMVTVEILDATALVPVTVSAPLPMATAAVSLAATSPTAPVSVGASGVIILQGPPGPVSPPLWSTSDW